MSTSQRNPYPTVDAIIELDNESIVLIKRENPPLGFALPGGFIDAGESAEDACIREAQEETGLHIHIQHLLGVYSDPNRDPRFHTLSCVYIARATGTPRAGDDAREVYTVDLDTLGQYTLAFDHEQILRDYLSHRETLQP